jgi:hypothetical protein
VTFSTNAPGGVGDGLCSETIVGVHRRESANAMLRLINFWNA